MGDFTYASELVRCSNAGTGLVTLSGNYCYSLEQFTQLRAFEQQRLRVLAAGRHMRKAVVSGKSAARLLGGWTMNTQFPEVIELTLPSHTAPSRANTPDGIVYRRAPLRDDEFIHVYGTRCTTPIRTAFDVAARHGFREGLVCADWVLSHTGESPANFEHEFSKTARFVGKGTVRRVLQHATALSESPYESWFRAVLIEREIPFEFQPRISGFRPDFLIGGVVAVEIDGTSKYTGRAEEALIQEKRRQDALTNMGYVFARFSPIETVREEDKVIRTILDLLHNRGRPAGS